MRKRLIFPVFGLLALTSCENVDGPWNDDKDKPVMLLEDVAKLVARLPIGFEQIGEVHDAVSGSSGNGYDEEYTMQDLFRSPGSGVGDASSGTKAESRYSTPLRDLLTEALMEEETSVKDRRAITATKAGGEAGSGAASLGDAGGILKGCSAADYLDALQDSDLQIYWPFSEDWDWTTPPIITFDPEDGAEVNFGYEVVVSDDGQRSLRTVLVDEDLARERPVWVINRNDDSGYTSLEMLRRNDPAWGEGGGGSIIVRPSDGGETMASSATKETSTAGKALLLKDFTMKRHFDPWFCGASEFFVKVGAVENFVASTEAELQLYTPQITDFMIVVKRSELDTPREFNAVLVSSWTTQLDQCALMIVEDDGGTKTTWSCSATVKIKSKSYGFDMSIPLNSRDDIVWRGQLSYKWLTSNSGQVGHFGDIDLTFEVVEY